MKKKISQINIKRTYLMWEVETLEKEEEIKIQIIVVNYLT